MERRDWITIPLGKVVTLQRGYDLPNRLRRPGEVPIVTSSGIGGTHNEAMVSGPGVVTGRYGTIGEVFYIESDFWPLNTTLFVRDFHGNDPLFVSYLLRTIDFQTHSGKSGVPGVNRNDLHEVVVSLPRTKAEQDAIAETLSDADALIESLEQLIAKKRQIKQGAIQELLTGKKRLPGFETKPGYKQTEVGVIPADWECTTVGQLVRNGPLEKPLDGNHGNLHPKSGDFVSFGIPFVMANNVRDGRVDLSNCAFIRKGQADSLQKGFSRPGDVLLTHKATIGNTAVVSAIPFEYIMLTPQVTYYRVANRARLSNFYLRHFFDSGSFQKVLLSMSGGGTRAYIGITAQLQLPVALPPTLAEQTAIATIVSDMDVEIDALEAKLAKARQLKQGIMQELLTGRIRLV
jgi:type I restriction enzyme S subunit